jgi:hypothetical protein
MPKDTNSSTVPSYLLTLLLLMPLPLPLLLPLSLMVAKWVRIDGEGGLVTGCEVHNKE